MVPPMFSAVFPPKLKDYGNSFYIHTQKCVSLMIPKSVELTVKIDLSHTHTQAQVWGGGRFHPLSIEALNLVSLQVVFSVSEDV